jgi:hypothetical protein
VGNGLSVFFWHDMRLGDCPLKLVSLRSFHVAKRKTKLLPNFLMGSHDVYLLIDRLALVRFRNGRRFVFCSANVMLSDSINKVKWLLDANKVFSTRSLYRFILNHGVRDLRMPI